MAVTVQKLRRVEIWSKWAAAGGVRQAVVSDVVACAVTATLANTDRLTLTIPLNSDAAPYLVSGAVIRIDESDGVFDEWKVVKGPTDSDATAERTVEAAPLSATDLVDCDLVRRLDADGTVVMDFESVGLTPVQHITNWVLPALVRGGLAWVTAGVITPTKVLDLAFQWDNPLSVLQRIADQTEMELDIRRVGAASYVIDLLPQVNSGATIADLRFDKNLQPGSEKAQDAIEQATRIFPRGAQEDESHTTMAHASWKVGGIAGLVVTLADPAGGVGPIQFDGQLAGVNGTTQAYLRKSDGSLTIVNASNALNQTVTVASVAGLAVGDLVEFRADVTGSDMVWLDSPPDRLTYGLKSGTVEVSDAPSTNNLLKNSAMRLWPGSATAPPPNWTQLGGGTVARQAVGPYTQLGGFSIHRVTAVDGDGLISDAVPIFPTLAKPYFSGYASIWVVSGRVRTELVFTTPTGPVVQPILPDVASNSVLGQFDALGVSRIDAFAIGATAVQLRVAQHGATPADFYLDYGQVTQSAAQLPFAEASGGTRLWQAANERLRTNGAPLVSYTIPLVDLAAMDPLTWAADKIVIGASVRVTHAGLAVAITTRIVELTRDYRVPGDSRVTLSNKPDDLTGARPGPPPRAKADIPSPTTPTDSEIGLNGFEIIAETATDLTRGWTPGALVAEVWAGYADVELPGPATPYNLVRANMNPVRPLGTNQFTIPKPIEKHRIYWQIEAHLWDLSTGEVKQGFIDAEPSQPPVVEVDDSEAATLWTQWFRIRERGLKVTSLLLRTQVGKETASALAAPTRGAPSASTVKGGLLGDSGSDGYRIFDVEEDCVRDPDRSSFIDGIMVLENGQVITLGPYSSDWDTNPNFLKLDHTGTVLSILCDTDCKSLRVFQVGGTWEYVTDGSGRDIDVSKIGTNGVAGLGASATATYTIQARSEPISAVDAGTIIVSRNVTISGSTAPPAAATWVDPISVTAPALGSSLVSISLLASAAPVGYTTRLRMGFGSPSVDHTADVAPALSAPPTVRTAYTYDTAQVRVNPASGRLKTFYVQEDLLDGGGVTVDSRTTSASWYSGEAT